MVKRRRPRKGAVNRSLQMCKRKERKFFLKITKDETNSNWLKLQ